MSDTTNVIQFPMDRTLPLKQWGRQLRGGRQDISDTQKLHNKRAFEEQVETLMAEDVAKMNDRFTNSRGLLTRAEKRTIDGSPTIEVDIASNHLEWLHIDVRGEEE